MKMIATFVFLIFISSELFAQAVLEEIVVTGRKREASMPIPGVVLTRNGDYLLLEVDLMNDTRDEVARRNEIYETLENAISRAEHSSDIELSIVDDEVVLPLNEENYRVGLEEGNRPDTSEVSIYIKAKIPEDATTPEGLMDDLRSFVDGVELEGRTEIETQGSVSISVVSPNQYRDEIIELFSADVEKVTEQLGDEYVVAVEGIDHQVHYYRVGALQVSLFIPYSYMVLPKSVNSFNVIGY